MDSVVISVSLYLISANIIAGTIYMFGQKKIQLLWLEYPFIYTPLIAFQFLMPQFMEIPGLAETELSLKFFLFMLQGFSCGVVGGVILLPRFFYKAESVLEKLKITISSSIIISLGYLISRWVLLEMFRIIIPEMQS
jgi:hypothetical protein